MSDYTPPPTHALSEKELEYIKSLSPKEFALHELALKKLGSSYFVWKSHGYIQWLSKNKSS
jgi:hypothetical protein